jgi:TRAP-type mannitol/chloroaromatic compound transport system substrate-binding protein
MFENISSQVFAAFIAPIVIGYIWKFLEGVMAVGKENLNKLPENMQAIIYASIARAELYLKTEEGRVKAMYAADLVKNSIKGKYDDVIIDRLVKKAFDQIDPKKIEPVSKDYVDQI